MDKIDNKTLFKEANKYIPGGVNSPVRSFDAVGGTPVFMKEGKGSRIFDEQDNEYIDYCLSYGPLILGHAYDEVIQKVSSAVKKGTSFGTPTVNETKLAQKITEAVGSIDKVRLVNSGTEAVMSAIRLARGYTGKDKIIKFKGAYHGHADHLLVKAGSGQTTFSLSDSPGVPQDFAKHTLIAPYNDLDRLEKIIKENQKDMAAILMEPVQANCGVITPGKDFLQGVRDLADKYNILLVFDEVITGFRLAYGGAQEYYGVEADITTLGKIIGGGMPVGAFGGKREIMEKLAPEGEVYQAGTLSGNPITVASGIATLDVLEKEEPYDDLAEQTENFVQKVEQIANEYNVELQGNNIGSIFSFSFTDSEIVDYKTAQTQDKERYSEFYQHLLNNNIYLSPSAFESNFLSLSHSKEDINRTIDIFKKTLKTIGEKNA